MRKLLLGGMLTLGGCHAAPDSQASLSLIESLVRDLHAMGGPFASKSRPIQPAVADFDLPFENDDTLSAAMLPVWSGQATGVPEFVDSDRAATHTIKNFFANSRDRSPSF